MEAPLIVDIMDDHYFSVTPECLLEVAIEKMHKHRSSYIMVENEGEPLGIITESDALGLLAESFQGVRWDHLTVDHVMTSPIISASLDLNILEAIIIAHGGKIRHIPVTDENGLLMGVVNQTQLVKALVSFCRKGDLW